MSFSEDYGPFLVLGVGLVLLGYAAKRKPRVREDRSGEECDPNGYIPEGYECIETPDGFVLQSESAKFIGYGPYPNRQAMDSVLEQLGFPGGDLAGFQEWMTVRTKWGLPSHGQVDRSSMLALKEAELMLEREEWSSPRS